MDGGVLVSEFNDHVPTPRATRRSMPTAAHVVVRYPSVNFSCQANVELRGWIGVFEDVDETFGGHAHR